MTDPDNAKRECRCVRVKHQHGTYTAYGTDGCRCFACRVAWSEAKRRRRVGGRYTDGQLGFVDDIGTTRRLQALIALGWRHADLEPRLSAILGRTVAPQQLVSRRAKNSHYVFAGTAEAVKQVYAELSMTMGPSQRNRDRALKRGYPPPLAWDDDTIDNPTAKPYRARKKEKRGGLDEIAIEEACRGRKVTLTLAERAEAVRRLNERGYSVKAASQFLGTTERLITRHRATAKPSSRGAAA